MFIPAIWRLVSFPQITYSTFFLSQAHFACLSVPITETMSFAKVKVFTHETDKHVDTGE
jgi:hypothetical protein